MAKFTFDYKYKNVEIKLNYKSDNVPNSNQTLWNKIDVRCSKKRALALFFNNNISVKFQFFLQEYLRDESKSPRNELRFSFCIPSTCTNKDLQESLEYQVAEYSNKTDIVLEVELNEKSCQLYEETTLDVADKLFL